MEVGILCGLVPIAFAIYGTCKALVLALFPVSYHLQNQPIREAAFLARELLDNDARSLRMVMGRPCEGMTYGRRDAA